jgi:hypothetical protein
VLVDFYSGTNALPKMIADKTVRTKDVRAFLEKDYPPDALPSVDEAQKLIAEHRDSMETHLKSEQRHEALTQLKHAQEARRQELEKERDALRQKQHEQRTALATAQRAQRDAHHAAYLATTQRIKRERYENRPTGLAGFLARVTGVEMVRKKLHQYQDKKRLQAYVADRDNLKQKQLHERSNLQRRQEMQALDAQRKKRALDQVEKKELKSLEESLKREARVHARQGGKQMPSLTYELRPPGRKADLVKAQRRFTGRDSDDQAAEMGLGRNAPRDEQEFRAREQLGQEVEKEFTAAAAGLTKQKQIDLEAAFNRAAKGDEEKGRGSSDGPAPKEEKKREIKIQRYNRKRSRDDDLDRGR